jgi:hypothetical protein
VKHKSGQLREARAAARGEEMPPAPAVENPPPPATWLRPIPGEALGSVGASDAGKLQGQVAVREHQRQQAATEAVEAAVAAQVAAAKVRGLGSTRHALMVSNWDSGKVAREAAARGRSESAVEAAAALRVGAEVELQPPPEMAAALQETHRTGRVAYRCADWTPACLFPVGADCMHVECRRLDEAAAGWPAKMSVLASTPSPSTYYVLRSLVILPVYSPRTACLAGCTLGSSG